MTTTTQVPPVVEVDGAEDELHQLLAVDEVGATLNAALVVMGDKLGLYRALADGGPQAPAAWALHHSRTYRSAVPVRSASSAGAIGPPSASAR